MPSSQHTRWQFKLFSTFGVILHVLFIDIPCDLWIWLTAREKSVEGKVIVITGAASGLGRRMAYLLAVKRKARVALLDTNEEGLRECKKEIEVEDGRAMYWKVDITDHLLMDTVAGEIEVEMGPVDIVVCNAAVLHFGFFLDLTHKQIQQALNVNVLGTINTIRSFLVGMEARRQGHVVAISSIAGFAGETYGLAYCPSKFAVRGVMECLQMEMRDRGFHNIKCSTICPYFARTPMVLNVGMRPTSTWVPFMSVNSCASRMVSAILKEKIIAFVPPFVGVIALFKEFSPPCTLRSLREYLNCRYQPSSTFSSTRTLLKMPDSFTPVHTVLWILIPGALLINFLAYAHPNVLRVIPSVGNTIADFSIAYPSVVWGTNVFAAVAHAGEGLLALFLSVQAGHSFSTAFKWFLQTLVMGFFSLRHLLAIRNKGGKKTVKKTH